MPIILIMMRDSVYTKCMNALQQVVAREGRPIIICEKDDSEIKQWTKQVTEDSGFKTLLVYCSWLGLVL